MKSLRWSFIAPSCFFCGVKTAFDCVGSLDSKKYDEAKCLFPIFEASKVIATAHARKNPVSFFFLNSFPKKISVPKIQSWPKWPQSFGVLHWAAKSLQSRQKNLLATSVPRSRLSRRQKEKNTKTQRSFRHLPQSEPVTLFPNAKPRLIPFPLYPLGHEHV